MLQMNHLSRSTLYWEVERYFALTDADEPLKPFHFALEVERFVERALVVDRDRHHKPRRLSAIIRDRQRVVARVRGKAHAGRSFRELYTSISRAHISSQILPATGTEHERALRSAGKRPRNGSRCTAPCETDPRLS